MQAWRSSFLIGYQTEPQSYLGRSRRNTGQTSEFERILDIGYRAVRTKREGMDELYDLQSDPYEMHNLFNNSDATPTLQDLRKELTRLLDAT